MPRKNEPTERMCAVSRETRPIAELIRFVVDPDGKVVPDLKRNLPGRGVWVTLSRPMLETALKRKVFARAFEGPVEVDPGLPDLVDRLLQEATLGTLGLARKAGSVVLGFAKVEAAIGRDTLAAVVHASEAGDDGVQKLAAAMSRRSRGMAAMQSGPTGEKSGLPVVRSFSGAQLDLALGRSNVIHAALLAGRASEIFLERFSSLERYRGGEAPALPVNDGHTSGHGPQDTTGS